MARRYLAPLTSLKDCKRCAHHEKLAAFVRKGLERSERVCARMRVRVYFIHCEYLWPFIVRRLMQTDIRSGRQVHRREAQDYQRGGYLDVNAFARV